MKLVSTQRCQMLKYILFVTIGILYLVLISTCYAQTVSISPKSLQGIVNTNPLVATCCYQYDRNERYDPEVNLIQPDNDTNSVYGCIHLDSRSDFNCSSLNSANCRNVSIVANISYNGTELQCILYGDTEVQDSADVIIVENTESTPTTEPTESTPTTKPTMSGSHDLNEVQEDGVGNRIIKAKIIGSIFGVAFFVLICVIVVIIVVYICREMYKRRGGGGGGGDDDGDGGGGGDGGEDPDSSQIEMLDVESGRTSHQDSSPEQRPPSPDGGQSSDDTDIDAVKKKPSEAFREPEVDVSRIKLPKYVAGYKGVSSEGAKLVRRKLKRRK